MSREKNNKNVMYLGPSISGVVRHSTIFKDGVLSKKLSECVKEFPAMKKLFVSVEDTPKAVKELNKEQSTLRTIYSQVEKRFMK